MRLNRSKGQAEAYVRESLKDSLPAIGMPKDCLAALLELDYASAAERQRFAAKYRSTLKRVYWGTFMGMQVPAFYRRYVIPHVLRKGVWLDVGCRKGILFQQVKSKQVRKVGIDITAHPDWKKKSDVRFRKFHPKEFGQVLAEERPDYVTCTWVLHHMSFKQQEKYFAALGKHLASGARLVILEDGYAERMEPENGAQWHRKLMALSKTERRRAMKLLDYTANIILSAEPEMPIPATFRTVEEWTALAQKHNFKLVHAQYIGFAKNRDIHTPQSVLVLERV